MKATSTIPKGRAIRTITPIYGTVRLVMTLTQTFVYPILTLVSFFLPFISLTAGSFHAYQYNSTVNGGMDPIAINNTMTWMVNMQKQQDVLENPLFSENSESRM